MNKSADTHTSFNKVRDMLKADLASAWEHPIPANQGVVGISICLPGTVYRVAVGFQAAEVNPQTLKTKWEKKFDPNKFSLRSMALNHYDISNKCWTVPPLKAYFKSNGTICVEYADDFPEHRGLDVLRNLRATNVEMMKLIDPFLSDRDTLALVLMFNHALTRPSSQ